MSSLPIIARAARWRYAQWLRAGISIWEYVPTMLHGKVALVDDHWSAVGSLNANAISIRYSVEVVLFTTHVGLASALALQLERGISACRPVTADDVERRPAAQRVLDGIAHFAMKLPELSAS